MKDFYVWVINIEEVLFGCEWSLDDAIRLAESAAHRGNVVLVIDDQTDETLWQSKYGKVMQ